MRFYMKEKDSLLKDRFFVQDDQGTDCYYVEGKILSLNQRLFLYNAKGEQLAVVQKKAFSLSSKYAVLVDDEEIAEISKEMSLFKPYYKVEGPDWTVDGDIWDREYNIRRNLAVIAKVSRPLLKKDTYQIDIDQSINPVMVLAVVLAIDCILEAEGEEAVAANNTES